MVIKLETRDYHVAAIMIFIHLCVQSDSDYIHGLQELTAKPLATHVHVHVVLASLMHE